MRLAEKRSAVIANGASLSGVIDIGTMLLTGIDMPSSWTAADLTFAASATVDGTYDPVFDSDGNELTVTAAASRFLALTSAEVDLLSAARFLKIRSGTSGAAVNQGGARTLVAVLK